MAKNILWGHILIHIVKNQIRVMTLYRYGYDLTFEQAVKIIIISKMGELDYHPKFESWRTKHNIEISCIFNRKSCRINFKSKGDRIAFKLGWL